MTTSEPRRSEHLGDPNGVLVVDETGFIKKGLKSAMDHRTGAESMAARSARSVVKCQG